jgi:mannose-1-phosphate guanylyltransferase / mannose-6-phosphate isomerase
MAALIPVVLCGGAGSRLWPVSREALPKPFIKLADGESLLAKALRRAHGAARGAGVLAVTHRDYFFLVKEEFESLNLAAELGFVLEPVARNTGPAIAAAALDVARRHGEEALMLVLPADQMIGDEAAFAAAVSEAASLAAQGWLVTFGVAPSRPETGFGYLEAGEALSASACRVKRFVEKPDAATAQAYLAAGTYRWNCGIFCFSAGTALAALRRHAPAVLRAVEAGQLSDAPEISFDYAVMEKAALSAAVSATKGVAMVRASFAWSDVGSWPAVAELTAADAQGNRVQGRAVLVDSARLFIQSRDRVVAAIGLEDLLIVDTPDALLVSRTDRAQDVKRVVESLKAESHDSVRHHRTVHRPWGTYTVLEEGRRFKIKRIVVKPGASLSLQRHRQRSEHWIVLSGRAKVVRGETETVIGPDESTFIRANEKHRLSNPGAVDCVMIEVQTGDYVGEDDIERLDDKYGRS